MKDIIAIVDDERDIADLLKLYLSNEGYLVETFYNGQDFLQFFDQMTPECELGLAILDLMLPDIDGYRLCQHIRQNSYCPIIMLTAKSNNEDKVLGLALGADDYITKPFHTLEVIARVKTQWRRYTTYNLKQNSSSYEIRGLEINQDHHKCLLYGKELPLTPIEFSILWYLCDHQGSVVSSETLFEAIWKEKYYQNSNNTVMAHIGRLREKLKDSARSPKWIKTIWGVGYTIEK